MKYLISATLLAFISSASYSQPFYRGQNAQTLDPKWEITIDEIVDAGPVDGKWWGERFIRVRITVRNLSDRYSFLKFHEAKFSDFNFNFIMNRNPTIAQEYAAHPDRFDKSGFYDEYPGLDLQVLIADPDNAPSAHYRDRLVFPSRVVNGRTLYSAALIAGKYGIPMSGPIDRSENVTGWLAPGQSRSLSLHYSVPAGGEIVRIEMPGKFASDLTLAPAQ